MEITTGRTVPHKEFKLLLAQDDFDPSDWVQVEGTPEQVAALSQRVALGAAEQERRKARRKAQKQARKRGR